MGAVPDPNRRPKPRCHGSTLIELVVTLAIVAGLALAAAPSFGTWMADARLRSTAEALQATLRQAQSTAIARSRTSVLALTEADPEWNAAPSANAAHWYARALPLPDSDEVAGSADYLGGASQASLYGVTITGPALLCFNSLGQLTTRSAAATGMGTGCTAPANDVAHPSTYRLARGGASRSFEVRVYHGGRVRMCDTTKSISNSQPDGC